MIGGDIELIGRLCKCEVLSCGAAAAARVLLAQRVLDRLCNERLARLKLGRTRLLLRFDLAGRLQGR